MDDPDRRLIETLWRSADDVRWASCTYRFDPGHAAAALAARGIRVSPSRARSSGILGLTHRIFEWADGGTRT